MKNIPTKNHNTPPTPPNHPPKKTHREEGEEDDERNELRETIFASLESVVLRCPREVRTRACVGLYRPVSFVLLFFVVYVYVHFMLMTV